MDFGRMAADARRLCGDGAPRRRWGCPPGLGRRSSNASAAPTSIRRSHRESRTATMKAVFRLLDLSAADMPKFFRSRQTRCPAMLECVDRAVDVRPSWSSRFVVHQGARAEDAVEPDLAVAAI